MSIRRRLYATFLGAGLVALFATTAWIGAQPAQRTDRTDVGATAVAFVAMSVAALAWLRPRHADFRDGLLLLMLAFAGAWAGGMLGALGLLFPAAWVRLAGSVARWELGLGSYLLAGVAFSTIWIVGGNALSPRSDVWIPPMVNVLLSVLFWPAYCLSFVGVLHWVPWFGD